MCPNPKPRNRKFFALSAALATGLLALGCSMQPGPAPQLQVQRDLLEVTPPMPANPDQRNMRAGSAIVIDEVRIEPSEAVGYENLPPEVTELYPDTSPFELTLADTVVEALANNRTIKVAGYSLRIAEYEIPVSKGIYDLITGFAASYSRVEEQLTADEAMPPGISARQKYGEAYLRQLFPTGGSIEVAINALREEARGPFSISGPLVTDYTVVSAVQLRQPLLRGLGPRVTNAGIRIAQLEHEGVSADFEATVEQTLGTVLETYWQLIGAIQQYKVQLISYAAARDLLRINKAKYEVGTVPQVDVLQAEAAAEARRDGLIQARQDVRDLEDLLKRLIFLKSDHPDWDRLIVPTQPFAWREMDVELETSIATAMQQRPELRRAHANIKQNEVSEQVAKNDVLPSLDLIAAASSSGLDNNFNESFHIHTEGQYIDASVGVEFVYPLQNRAARYRLKQSRTALQASNEQLLDTTDQITLEVRQAVRALKTARERIDVTRTAVKSEEEKLRSERRRLEVGSSTAFQVLQFQEDLAAAQSLHLRAVVDYNVAAVQLERACGTLLETYGISMVGEDTLNPTHEEVIFPVGLD